MVTITHTKPKYNNYQVNSCYLDVDNVYFYINIDEHEISIPLEKLFLKQNDKFDLITPINFQASLGSSFWIKNIIKIYELLKMIGCVCCFIQVKDDFQVLNNININTSRYITNYYFDLEVPYEKLLKNKSKSSRLKLKKILNNLKYRVVEDLMSDDFYTNYYRISRKKSFSEKYKISKENFLKYTNVNTIKYIEIQENNQFVAGGFFGFNNDEIDYLYGSSSEAYPDAIRLLIWEAVKYFKEKGQKRLFLGGGITPNDSLADFKRRLGTMNQKCRSIKMVVDTKTAEKIDGTILSESWYESFFPPYRKILK